MRTSTTSSLVIFISLLIFNITLQAQVPGLLNYQGRLIHQGGDTLTGTYTMMFSIYESESGGIALWSETHNSVEVTNGIFQVLLGSVTSFQESLFSGSGDRFLGIKVGSYDEMSPRFRITSVAYALRAALSDSAEAAYTAMPDGPANGDLSGTYPDPEVAGIQGRAISTDTPADGNILKWSDANNRWEPSDALSGSTVNTTTRLTGDGSPGSPLDIAQQNAVQDEVLKWDGSTWSPAADSSGGPPSGDASGDLLGTYPDPEVAGIRGRAISSNSPADGNILKWSQANNRWEPSVDLSSGTVNTTTRLAGDGSPGSPLDIAQQGAVQNQVLKWDGSTWSPAADSSGGGSPSGDASGDLSGTYPDPNVAGIQGRAISSNSPADGNILKWSQANNRWEPSVDLSGGTVNTTTRLSGDGSPGSPLDIAQQGAVQNQVLKWDGTAWVPNTDNTGGNTLDQAYDQGGAGQGRTINADAGAVNIAGTGGLTVNGTVTATTFSGSGAALTNLNGSNISSGTVPNARLDADLQDLADGSLSGSKIGTGIDANNISTGTIASGRLSGTYSSALTFSNPSNSFVGDGSGLTNVSSLWTTSGSNIYYNAGNVGIGISTPGTALDVSGTVRATTFSGSGASLSNLNASNLSSGTVSSSLLDADLQDLADGSLSGSKIGTGINATYISTGILASGRLSGTYSSQLTFSNSANSFTGNGASLNSLNASNISSGTVSDGRLESTIDRTRINASDYMTALGGIHVGGTADPTTDNLWVDGNVGIRTTSPPSFPLDILPGTSSRGINILHNKSTTGGSIGIRVEVNNTSSGAGNVLGMESYTTNDNGDLSTWGIYSKCSGTATGPKVGLYGHASSTASTTYGVLGYTDSGSPAYAVYAMGDLGYSGSLLHVSDRKLKENEKDLSNILSKLLQLKPKTYTHISDAQYKHMNLSTGNHYGLIAQDLESIFPDLVVDAVHPGIYDETTGVEGEEIHYKAIKYIELIPILIEGMKEQQKLIEDLKKELDMLKNR